MSELTWDDIGTRTFETGVDHGVLYLPDEAGAYTDGVAWNGLTAVTESPSGADANPQYADNIKYLNLYAAEQFGGTIEAFTYPDEWALFDGLAVPTPGVAVGQQARRSFGLCYRTKIGNDIDGNDHGFKLHLVYGASATPSEKAYKTVNESPEAIAFSWTIATIPVAVTDMAPTSLITIDSTVVDADSLADLMQILYGDVAVDPALPFPDDVIALFAGSVTEATATTPAYNSGTHTITIPTVTGVTYRIGGVAQTAGAHVIAVDTLVTATPNTGYILASGSDDDWFFEF